jgi:plastocyanin
MPTKFAGLLVLVLLMGAGCSNLTATQVDELNETENIQGEVVIDDDQDAMNDAKKDDDSVMSDTPVEGMVEEGVKVFEISGGPFYFNPNLITVNKGDTVRIVFTNEEGFHDWVLDEFDAKTKQIQAGQTETIEFVADEAGEFEYYCSVGTHRQMGMVGTLIVKE